MRKTVKRKDPRSIKLPSYSPCSDYEPEPTREQELDAVWDGETIPASDD